MKTKIIVISVLIISLFILYSCVTRFNNVKITVNKTDNHMVTNENFTEVKDGLYFDMNGKKVNRIIIWTDKKTPFHVTLIKRDINITALQTIRNQESEYYVVTIKKGRLKNIYLNNIKVY